MKHLKYKFYVLFIFLTGYFSSCQEKPDFSGKEGPGMFCKVETLNVTTTKGEISKENLKNAEIAIYALRNNSNLFKGAYSTIKPSNVGDIWQLQESATSSVQQTWGSADNNKIDTYKFHGYAYNNSKDSKANITLEKEGQIVHIVQPSTDYMQTIDYLLSYAVSYGEMENANKTKPLIPLQFEHAFTKISLDLNIKSNVEELQITFSNIKNKGILSCTHQKEIKNINETQNDWIYKIDNKENANYTWKATAATPIGASRVMSFIAIPADKSIMKTYQLKVNYKVASTSFERIFNLVDYSTWDHGHHVVYQLEIDHEVHLVGSIKNWTDVDFIEGTILPPLDNSK